MRLQWWSWGAVLALLSGAEAEAQRVKQAPLLLVIIPANDSQSYALARATNQSLRRLVDTSALAVFPEPIERAHREWQYEEGPKSGAAGGPAMLPQYRAQLAVMIRADILIAFAPDSARSRTGVTVLVSASPKFIDSRAIGTWQINDIGKTAQQIATAIRHDETVHQVLLRRR